MANVNGTEIDLQPTEAMQAEARRYRVWKEEGRQGGTDVAATRASQILSGDELSADTVITMAAWFARHEVDKAGEGFSPGEDGYPSPGRVAWAAWGGDPGQSWADARAARIKAAQDRAGLGHGARPYPNEHAARLVDPGEFDEFRRETDAGGPGIDFIYGIKGSEPIRIQAIRFDAARYSVAEARKWLADHDRRPILFEEATGDRGIASLRLTESQSMEVRELNKEPLRRVASFDYGTAVRAAADPAAEPSRSLEFSFSSEAPVARWFGDEVLSHEAAAVDLSRLNDGAPLLWNHNPDQVLGVVERGWIDGKRRGMASVRFSRSAFAEEKLAEVRDGILRNVSVGYSIGDYQRQEDGSVLATSWQPMEVSIVSVPADQSIGVGRSLKPVDSAAPAATPTPPQSTTMESLDLTQERAAAAADAVTAERSRIAAITNLTREHGADDLAGDLIASGATEADAMRQVLATIAKRAKQPASIAAPSAQPIGSNAADIGLTEKESRSYSFVRAIRAQAFPQDAAMQREAAFEREVSEATAARMGVDRDGFHIPHDVLKRDLTAGLASGGGDMVFTDARPGSFIELLRNRLALSTLGVTTLTGLNGPVAIPKQLSGATGYWLAEKGAGTESSPTVGQVNLTPKTLGAYTEYSRRLLLQSSIDVETMVRNELVTVMALEIDRAALYGTGSTSQPQGLKNVTGINTVDFAANAPTYAEIIEMLNQIAADNADIGTMAFLTTSTRYGGFLTTERASSTAAFILQNDGPITGLPVIRSNQVASDGVWLGVESAMLIGMWGAITLQVHPYALDTSGGVRVTAFQDVDVAVRYPECFCRGNNNL